MAVRILMLLALASLAFGNAAMARGMPMRGPMPGMPETTTYATSAACCPDSNDEMPLPDCVTCCVLAPNVVAVPVKSEIRPVAACATAPKILVQREFRPLDPPPRPFGQIEN